MKRLTIAFLSTCMACTVLACKKDMPPVVAPHWQAIEDLARAAGTNCDRVLALTKCPLEDGLPDPGADPEARLPKTSLVGRPEIREIEVYCESGKQGEGEFSHNCYLERYFDPKGAQRAVRWTCGGNKPYPGWEHTKDGLATAYENGCKENVYHAWVRRKSPAGNTVQAGVYFYIDGHAPTAAPEPVPQ